jgi:hypothetical protein
MPLDTFMVGMRQDHFARLSLAKGVGKDDGIAACGVFGGEVHGSGPFLREEFGAGEGESLRPVFYWYIVVDALQPC